MTEQLKEARDTSDDFADILRAVNAQRTRLETFAAQHRDKTASLSASLKERLENFANTLQQREQAVHELETSLQTQQAELAGQRTEAEERLKAAETREQTLQEREAQLKKDNTDLELRQTELLERAAELDDDVARVAEERAELEGQRTLLAAEIQQLAERREHLQTKLEELETEREECSAKQSRTEEQRRRLAERMQARRKELMEQRAQLIASTSDGDGEAAEKLSALQSQLGEVQQRAEELESQLEKSQSRCQELEAGGAAPGVDTKEMEQLAHACRDLERRANADKKKLAELQQQLEQTQSELELARESSGDGEGGDEYRKRYEMAVSDLREERARIGELESQLAKAKLNKGVAADDSGGMDWEAQKRRLLASLESDFNEDDEQSQQDKLTLEEAIRVTDEAVAAKERELEQLQQILEQQSSNVGNMAVGAAAVADLLDKDELIRQERENLKQIQQEWRDKLRQSEIDISLERAKLARDKSQIEEKLRELEEQTAQRDRNANGNGTDDKKGARGNWLTRMGLKGD